MFSKQTLKNVVLEQHETRLPTGYVHRAQEADLLERLDSKFIQILAGLRRSGKSTLLQWVRSQHEEQDYYVNFDDERLSGFEVEHFQLLLDVLGELYGDQKIFYFDEIQVIPEWERFVRRIHDQGAKIYVTGSNADMLSYELGTRLTGRYIQTIVYPFSFLEFVDAKKLTLPAAASTTKERTQAIQAFEVYMKLGGLPEYVETSDTKYLEYLLESIVYRDIVARYQIREDRSIRQLASYLASNIGKLVTFNRLKSLLGVSSATTVSKYCECFQNCYYAYFVNQYDGSLRKQMNTAKKVYLVDMALAQQVGFRSSEDAGRFLENAVFIELKRRGEEVYFHQGKQECDFVLLHGIKVKAAIQVTLSMTDPVTRERELRGLKEAMAVYDLQTGLILTESERDELEVEVSGKSCKVVVMPAWEWMMAT